MVTVFEVHRDGLIGAVTFIYRKGELQTYYIGVRWKEGGVPEIQGTSVSNVAEIKLTEKGYFIYAYEYVIAHASLRQYWRIEPLPEDCRELTEKYISGNIQRKDGFAMSYVCRSRQRSVKSWMEAA